MPIYDLLGGGTLSKMGGQEIHGTANQFVLSDKLNTHVTVDARLPPRTPESPKTSAAAMRTASKVFSIQD